MKLSARLSKLEHANKPKIVWPPFEMMYEPEDAQRAWFEQHNPSIDYDEFNKDRLRFDDLYEKDLTFEEVKDKGLDWAPVKQGSLKERDEIISKYGSDPVEWMIRTECYINKF